MKQILIKIKNNKLLFILTLITGISILLGILYPAIITKENEELIKVSITSFFKAIDSNKLNYTTALISSLSNNIIISIVVWILGISIIGLPLIIFILLFKSFILGFSITSILLTYGWKGILSAIIYSLPCLINLLGLFLLAYYAITISLALGKDLFQKKEMNKKRIMKRYLKIGIFALVFFILTSLLEVYIMPSILKIL